MRASGSPAALGAIAGVLIAPITFTSYDVGVMLGLKGFAAAILGGLGSFPGAIVGGLVLGLLESFGAGFVSSAYKDVDRVRRSCSPCCSSGPMDSSAHCAAERV